MWISKNKNNQLQSCKAYSNVKLCPFCGGAAKVFAAFGTSVECTKCGARVYDLYDKNAISKWNKRVSGTSGNL